MKAGIFTNKEGNITVAGAGKAIVLAGVAIASGNALFGGNLQDEEVLMNTLNESQMVLDQVCVDLVENNYQLKATRLGREILDVKRKKCLKPIGK